jgi:hypothetical protein
MKKSLGVNNRLRKFFLNTDLFGQKVELNFNGEPAINSIFGSIVSLFIYTTVAAFALYRMQVMVTYGATTVTQNERADGLDQSFTFDFDSNNFKIAVGVVPQVSGTSFVHEDYFEIQFFV